MLDKELALAVLRRTHKPHWLCKDLAGDLWEFISWPYIEGDAVAIKIRVPGDPTSMITADAASLDPEDHQCYCGITSENYYLRADYYAERHARLHLCPARIVGLPEEQPWP